jgi:hypothetical protein
VSQKQEKEFVYMVERTILRSRFPPKAYHGPNVAIRTKPPKSTTHDPVRHQQKQTSASTSFLYLQPVRAASICTTALQPAQFHGLHGFDDYDSELIIGAGAGER